MSLSQSELVEEFRNQFGHWLNDYVLRLYFDDRDRFERVIMPHIGDMLVAIEERIENILEDEVLSDEFTGE